MAVNKVLKPATQRGKRYLEKRESKLIENDKTAIFLRGETNELTKEAMKELVSLKKPLATMYKRKNPFRPFDDPTTVEAIARKEDASLFSFGSHSKKRPNNLVFGRLYNHQILDMFEFGIEKFKSMKTFDAAKLTLGSKPCLIFVGEPFETDPEMIRLKNLFIDFFRGPVVSQVRLAGIEVILQFTIKDGKIFFRCYRILLKKSGTKIPRVELEEVGPSLDLVMRRTKLASDDLFKEARKVPKAVKPKKKKNISHDAFGNKQGRIHLAPQDFSKLQTRKMAGLKRKQRKEPEDKAEGEEEHQPTKKQKSPEESDE